MKIKLFLSLALLLSLSCARKTDKLITADVITFDSFEKEINITAHPTTISVMGTLSLSVCDNLLIATTMNPTSIFSVVDIDTENVLLECGGRGRGPGEFLSVNTQKQFLSRNGHIHLWLYDHEIKGVLWDITGSIENQRFVFESCPLNEKYRQNNGILILPTGEYFTKFPVTYHDPLDKIFFYPNYFFLSSMGEKNKELPFFNDGSSFSSPAQEILSVTLLMFDGLLRLKPDATKAIDAFRHAEHLNILDLDKNRGFSMNYSQGFSVDEIVSMSIPEIIEKCVEVYIDASVTNNYILALYSGKSEAEDPNTAQYTKSMIRIFDWNGKPLALVHVDKELKSIAYDERTQRLYALDSEENIIYYALDNII